MEPDLYRIRHGHYHSINPIIHVDWNRDGKLGWRRQEQWSSASSVESCVESEVETVIDNITNVPLESMTSPGVHGCNSIVGTRRQFDNLGGRNAPSGSGSNRSAQRGQCHVMAKLIRPPQCPPLVLGHFFLDFHLIVAGHDEL